MLESLGVIAVETVEGYCEASDFYLAHENSLDEFRLYRALRPVNKIA